MKVALIGATGNAGSRILVELLDRGHNVTGIARRPEKLQHQQNLTAERGDVHDIEGMSRLLSGHDAVIHSVKFLLSDPRALLRAMKMAGVMRLIVVGGAGSLEVATGKQFVDDPEFPKAAKEESLAGREFLNILRTEQDVDWTFLSPSALFIPGRRTGNFRVGSDQLLIGQDGCSRISQEDYAIALVDELEKPNHSRRRFTVGY